MELKFEIILTKEQSDLIVQEWNSRKENPPSIKELIKLVFENENLDGRNAEGIAIRKFLAEKSFNYPAKEKIIIELTEENKEFIRNNCSTMTGPEMSRIIFNNHKLMAGHPETRLVLNYKKTLDSALMYVNEKELKSFKSPKNDEQVIKIVNGIVLSAFNEEKIDGATKKCLIACIAYMNNERFLTEIETYQEANERKMFINNYIRHIYDKPDLTQQDLDIMILFSNEVIEHKRIQDQMAILRRQQEMSSEEPDAKMSMSLVEMINNCTNNLSKSKKVQADLLKEINEKRSDRLKKEAANHNSLLNLFADWQQEESRKKLLDYAIARKEALGEEVDKLSALDEIKVRIFGLTKEEMIYGSE